MILLRIIGLQLLLNYAQSQMLALTTVNQKEDSRPVSEIKAPTCMHVRSRGYLTLRGGLHAGRFTKHTNIKDIEKCIDECCSDETCTVAYLPGGTCYTVSCTSSYLCDTIPAVPSSLPAEDVQVVHVIRNKDDMYQDDMLKRNGMEKRNAVGGNGTEGIGNSGSNRDGNRNSVMSQSEKNSLIWGIIKKKLDGDLSRKSILSIGYNTNSRANIPVNGAKSAVCEFSCVISHHKNVPKTATSLSLSRCAHQCCQDKTCKAITLRNNKCAAIKNLCSRSTHNGAPIDLIVVQVTKRNGQRIIQGDSTCLNPHCAAGKCNEIPCFCDQNTETRKKGIKGRNTGKIHCTHQNCHPPCGEHGTCDVNKKCLCDQGWTGVQCNTTNKCTPPCTNGICLISDPRKCKCDFGWSGASCNTSYMEPNVGDGFGHERDFGRDEDGDMDVEEGGREGVYFLDSDAIPELNVRLPQQQRFGASTSKWRTLTMVVIMVMCGVGVTSLIVSAIIMIARRMVTSQKVDQGLEKMFGPR